MAIERIPFPRGTVLPGGVRYGDCIAVAGQLSVDENGRFIGEGDIYAQAEQCFHNIERILNVAGAGLTDIVSVTGYLCDSEDWPAFNAVRTKKLGGLGVAGTTVVVAGLLHQHALIEVQVTAYKPQM